ncbi:hypothetical protein AVEN_198907-1 [Araneus ventricosus]|uniref:Uncharacterized protein n=1 Tax=Araneus ventricosus TaxID=182803 RepID=A0A4Y2QDY0_ARAVE|nr:hypothetical protein AVEN_198907-1 [Araneus ventricosus]
MGCIGIQKIVPGIGQTKLESLQTRWILSYVSSQSFSNVLYRVHTYKNRRKSAQVLAFGLKTVVHLVNGDSSAGLLLVARAQGVPIQGTIHVPSFSNSVLGSSMAHAPSGNTCLQIMRIANHVISKYIQI